LQELGTMATVVGENIRGYLSAIFALLHEYWLPAGDARRVSSPELHAAMIGFYRACTQALGDGFRLFVPEYECPPTSTPSF
jgi:hypothetical protein